MSSPVCSVVGSEVLYEAESMSSPVCSVVGSEALYDEAHTSMIRSSPVCSVVGWEAVSHSGSQKKRATRALKKNEPLGSQKKEKNNFYLKIIFILTS